ncbi:hypothetical protein JCM16303_001959 [Sporobolomyces ruberrimus]
MLRTLLLSLGTLSLVPFATPLSLSPRQFLPEPHLASLTSEDHSLPFVGAPLGPFYRSTKLVTCDPIRITFGGGSGPTYFLAVVNGTQEALPPSDNSTAIQDPDRADTFTRLGIMGIPGMTWWDLNDETDERFKIGNEVALQVVDGMGNVGYSLPRKILKGHPNEFCYYPGAIWPPSRWDGTHYSAILLFFFFVIPFSISYLTGYKSQLQEKASEILESLSIKTRIKRFFERFSRKGRSRRRDRRRRRARGGNGDGDETEGALQLEERLERGETSDGEENPHVLGGDDDEEDDERTSIEEDSNRPLLNEEGSRRNRSNSLPPGYEEATKEDPPDTTEMRAT